jgi:hypothetical protein
MEQAQRAPPGLPPASRAELLHVLMLPDCERADRIGEFWGYPESRAFAELLIDWRGGPDAPGGARRDVAGGPSPTSALVRRRTASPSSGDVIDDCAPLAYLSTCPRGVGRGGTRFEFGQHPCDKRVRAGPPHRLERPVEGGSDLLNASA